MFWVLLNALKDRYWFSALLVIYAMAALAWNSLLISWKSPFLKFFFTFSSTLCIVAVINPTLAYCCCIDNTWSHWLIFLISTENYLTIWVHQFFNHFQVIHAGIKLICLDKFSNVCVFLDKRKLYWKFVCRWTFIFCGSKLTTIGRMSGWLCMATCFWCGST